ncbi:hypothetical protein K438DRAFT_583275 [Mycena galopus ATCC 62051]|nr:hypothetical protein K438DRAFT_583275 [Mycena galopus ATCC 62051]
MKLSHAERAECPFQFGGHFPRTLSENPPRLHQTLRSISLWTRSRASPISSSHILPKHPGTTIYPCSLGASESGSTLRTGRAFAPTPNCFTFGNLVSGPSLGWSKERALRLHRPDPSFPNRRIGMIESRKLCGFQCTEFVEYFIGVSVHHLHKLYISNKVSVRPASFETQGLSCVESLRHPPSQTKSNWPIPSQRESANLYDVQIMRSELKPEKSSAFVSGGV